MGLSVLDEQAESLKHQYGECYADMVQEDDVITVPGIAGRPPKEISKGILARIIQARMEEILEIVGIEIKRSGYGDALSAGIVITGGGLIGQKYLSIGCTGARDGCEDWTTFCIRWRDGPRGL